ncbi:glucose 1-dehydrogenase [Knoellia subterranea]|uniref:Glucose-1-dehydrogenase n=1 Tax=Knoellia subterranea KCTC 19937 TaxID=1385521 RepID=A0A0A0JNV4_9MICO|nr:glucose 1-dehydrogenase [Knoellia subterranea]KGN39080.1 glucose-1-dehydrogenase [Knoellia subterranea KCTC 19937]
MSPAPKKKPATTKASAKTEAADGIRPLEGKVVIVTGGNSGIGEGIVREAAAQGAKVVIDYVSHPEATDAIIADIEKAGGEAVGCEADVSKVADLQKLVDTAVKEFGRLDVMVNNAGVEFGETLESLTEEKYDLLMNINLKGAVFGSKLAAEQMRIQGDGGVIINITSTHEDWPMPSDLAYCVSKGGMRMLTRTAGVELGPDHIRMIGVGPGAINTPINADDTPEETKALEAAIPLGYIGSPEEMGKIVCWAASDQASYITATTVMADGGLMQKPGAV